ncbi:MAG: hypothetical protein O9312_09830 [Hylemonella sp.]|nr:hypothetical protein [Hylemonella sp.]
MEFQAKAESFVADAGIFTDGAVRLAEAPMEDIDRVWVRLTGTLRVVQTIRDELDRKYTAMATQNLQHREMALKSRNVG